MTCEDGEAPRDPEEIKTPADPVDPHRAFRELQRWLGVDDQGRPYSTRVSRCISEENRGELVLDIVYNTEARTVDYRWVNETKPQAEVRKDAPDSFSNEII